jgi:hypothetical protein
MQAAGPYSTAGVTLNAIVGIHDVEVRSKGQMREIRVTGYNPMEKLRQGPGKRGRMRYLNETNQSSNKGAVHDLKDWQAPADMIILHRKEASEISKKQEAD